MKRVILFGDSNTFGRLPGTEDGRLPFSSRWPVLLAESMGNEWDIIDEGFPGRTILPQESVPAELNGYESILSIMERNIPFNYIFIMLGTNDFKTKYHANPEDVLCGMERLVDRIRTFSSKLDLDPKIIIASPPVFQPVVPAYSILFENANKKMQAFSHLLHDYAKTSKIPFVDTSAIIPDKRDGIHLSEETQPMMARLLHDILLSI